MDARVAAVRSRSHLRVSVASRRDDRRPRCRWAARRQPASRRRRCARCRAREVRRAPRGRSVPRRVPHGARRRRGRSARVANGDQWRRLPSRRFSDVFRAWSTGLTCAPRLYCPAAHSAAGRSRTEALSRALQKARRASDARPTHCASRVRPCRLPLRPPVARRDGSSLPCCTLPSSPAWHSQDDHWRLQLDAEAVQRQLAPCSAHVAHRLGSALSSLASIFVCVSDAGAPGSQPRVVYPKYAVQIVAIACACIRYLPSHVYAATRCYVGTRTTGPPPPPGFACYL